jgi:hypothetical protein
MIIIALYVATVYTAIILTTQSAFWFSSAIDISIKVIFNIHNIRARVSSGH